VEIAAISGENSRRQSTGSKASPCEVEIGALYHGKVTRSWASGGAFVDACRKEGLVPNW